MLAATWTRARVDRQRGAFANEDDDDAPSPQRQGSKDAKTAVERPSKGTEESEIVKKRMSQKVSFQLLNPRVFVFLLLYCHPTRAPFLPPLPSYILTIPYSLDGNDEDGQPCGVPLWPATRRGAARRRS